MQLFTLYASTLIIFLVVDMIGISFIVKPVFERSVGDLLELKLGPAAMFYCFYIAGLLYFVSVPAMAEGNATRALLAGALLGLMCYGTYEFTNLSTLRVWTWNQVIVDCIWGTVLTGGSAWAGLTITRWIHG
ncbi:hypothetical protein GCM10011415_19880 [Salipiger pallidus]|uniref:DUF2177 domain-containing protein n=1 Tax=Salipiger pallidus TaxID=1775170 RepID=A0A8J2ZJN7_9RHOB|nr:DUF2177 family protein [Salipiger pallidus]GGG71948.1 hypothetical protein GCM10011415_19880 [Salipiger pallidus]